MRRLATCGLVSAALVGCGSPAAQLAAPPRYAPDDQVMAGAAKNVNEPLIIEWPAAQRTKLESLARKGAVVVRYEGEAMDVLGQCHVARRYAYTSTTPQHERVSIRSQDDLHATLPLGGAKLSGALERSGQLDVSLTVVGTFEVDRDQVRQDELEGDCAQATHVVTALTVGAFELQAASKASVGAKVTAGPLPGDAGAQSSASHDVLNQGGDGAACAKATGDDRAPPYGCGALLRVEVTRLLPARPLPPASTALAPVPTAPPADPPVPSPLRPAPAEVRTPSGRPVLGEAVSFTDYRTPRESAKPASNGYFMPVLLGALVLVGIGIGTYALVASKKDTHAPGAPGGLGSTTASMGARPLFQW